eukprot:TRINITY_DN740_c0_g1_i2.p1 TRINITY_DN740_c0_g1~~TRINITY_DN740_c0_g1_i2.p1  ORF type:complete len:479 (+),score=170.79 TRINITY_DN740_c0_g1_i2:376-1812(+)
MNKHQFQNIPKTSTRVIHSPFTSFLSLSFLPLSSPNQIPEMLSQFFLMSPRGDTLINKDYRGDIVKGTAEIFFRKAKFWKGDAPPVFNLDGINFIHIKRNGLYFVVTTKMNISASFALELLNRLAKLFKDYCGILSEDSIRKNFVLVYEMLDEVLDFGYPQDTTTENLKPFIRNEAVQVESSSMSSLGTLSQDRKTTPSSSTNKPISTRIDSQRSKRNEIFVDLLERLTVLFSNTGDVLRSEIDGCIQMKSYLSGNPELRLALNEELVVGGGSNNYGMVVLDDANFHECVNLDLFESERTMVFNPPEGEFEVMHYRISSEFRAPFRIFPFVEEVSTSRIDVLLKVRADIPENANGNNVVVRLPLPKSTNNVSCEMAIGAVGQSWEYKQNEHVLEWTIKKFPGGVETFIRAKIFLQYGTSSKVKREIGPISMEFEIPMYNCSNVNIRFLRVLERNKSYVPYRWVRYITHSNSYVSRVGK